MNTDLSDFSGGQCGSIYQILKFDHGVLLLEMCPTKSLPKYTKIYKNIHYSSM